MVISPSTVTITANLKRRRDSDDDRPITDNCDVVRRKINAFITSGEMKVTEFQRTIGVNSNSYGRFMKLKGPLSGNTNQVWYAAFRFFDDRRKAGIKPTKKKVKKDDETKKFDLSGVAPLPGEREGTVSVWETSDEIRKKINAFLREPDVMQNAFLREIAKFQPTTTGEDDGTKKKKKAIQSKQLKDFLGYTGPLMGNTSKVFYCSYVFFEKMRLKQGKPKTEMRRGTEAAWCAEGGVDTKRGAHRGYLCSAETVMVEDKYGQLRVEKGRGF
ncbi:MAG: hypothetical protein LQ350_007839 [Teloschistes chrysophthalmus]|nr:MAG: hypothetical protein LQ350_007839 [Niorma chrysophthalma]